MEKKSVTGVGVVEQVSRCGDDDQTVSVTFYVGGDEDQFRTDSEVTIEMPAELRLCPGDRIEVTVTKLPPDESDA